MGLIDMKRKRNKIVECPICKGKNNLTEMEENNDIDIDELDNDKGYIFCVKCGNQFEVKVNE